MNKFTYKLFSCNSKKEGNLLLSPISFTILFAILLKGSRGEIHEIIESLFEENLTGEYLESITNLVNELEKSFDQGVFESNNFIEHTDKLRVKGNFLSAFDKKLLPEILNLETEEENLHCIIKNEIFVGELWNEKFNDIEKGSDIFILKDGKKVESQFIYQSNINGRNNIEYLKEEKYHAIRIPAKDQRICFEILLPYHFSGLDNLIDHLDSRQILEIGKHFKNVERLEVYIPKLNFNCYISLKELSDKLEIQGVFDPTWDFDKMIDSPDVLFLKDIIQANSISLDRYGFKMKSRTEARFGIGSSVREPSSYILFEANHPFIFVVREKQTNTILQIGKFSIPNQVPDSEKFINDEFELLLR